MTWSWSNSHSNVLIGLVLLLASMGWSNSSVINGRKNNSFDSDSMLRDSSTTVKGVVDNNDLMGGSLNGAQRQQPQYRSVIVVGQQQQNNIEDDSLSSSMMMNGKGAKLHSYVADSDGRVMVASSSSSLNNGDDGTSSDISDSDDNGVANNNNNDDVGIKDTSDDNDDDDDNILLPLNDQVRLLTKQLNALMTRRREDYELLENNLRKSLRITNNAQNMDMNIRSELDQLRHEIKTLRDSHIGGNKEKLTVEWISQSIAEIRKELSELQGVASKASKDVSQRTQNFEDLATIKSDFHQFKLELEALKERQQTTEVFVKELREDAIQREEDMRRILLNRDQSDETNTNSVIQLNTDSEADHKRRHHRIQRQQLHELELAQRDVKRQLNELQYHRIGERVRNLEIEQHRIAGANFNLSRQIASLDKLHTSMLELLEDVEGLQNKMDKTMPDVRREISKLEFNTAQLSSEQSLIREEGQNVARSVQAMAVSVSALQEERDSFKDMQMNVDTLRKDVERLQSITEVQKSIVHRRIEKMEMEAKRKAMLALDLQRVNKADANIVMADYNVNKSNSSSSRNDNNRQANAENIEIAAQNLVEKLESVELQYESIINKLPNDCSQVEKATAANSNSAAVGGTTAATSSGLYLIAPAGQNKPVMAHCSGDGWTTIQRRFDGSVDFNRSWEAYANGFGSPSGEYWIGNEMLHHLTADNCTELKIVMQDIYDNTWYAQYKNFYISPRDDGYRLHIKGYSGNASDALDYQNEMQFSAIDVDRDISNTHCAANYEGGWWFSHCQHANLNGRYNLGLTWFDASRNEWIAVKSSQMLITKRQSCSVDTTTTVVRPSSSSSNQSHHKSADASTATMTTTVTGAAALVSSSSSSSTTPLTGAAVSTSNSNDDEYNTLTIVSGRRAVVMKSPQTAVITNAELT
ncbi:protein scabrous [Episyrphus balteatus]|uniref:protein scabrous n=1 Tax=Episyrphus balteatus TaxID=286459 RepID=UPI0024855CF0|nr:protein scabrous [Episyrphus balteatus]